MRALLIFEMKKILSQRLVIVSALILLVINVFNIFQNYDLYFININSDYEKGLYSLYKTVEGEMTAGKVQSVIDHINELKGVQTKAEAEKLGIELYLEDPGADINLCQNLIDEMQKIYKYNDSITDLRERNELQREVSVSKGNDYLQRLCDKIDGTYTERHIGSFYRTENFERYFSYDFSSFLVLLILLLALSSVFSGENEKGMSPLLSSAKNGRLPLSSAKILSATGFTAVICVLFYLSDFITFLICQRLSGFSNPLYSIPEYRFTPLGVSIGGFILLNTLLKTVGFIYITMIICTFSSLFKKSYAVLFVSFGFILMLMYAGGFGSGSIDYINMFNPISLITIKVPIKNFSVINIFGFPIFRHTLTVICCFFGCMLFCHSVTELNNRNALRRRKYEAA